MELPDWLKEECTQDPTMDKLVQMGARKDCSLERILDTVARFVLDREQLAMHQLWRYRRLYGKLPKEDAATASQVDAPKKEKSRIIKVR